MRILGLAALLLCAPGASVSSVEITDMEAAQSRWDQYGACSAHTFEFIRYCDCEWSDIPLAVSVETGVSSFSNPRADEFFAFPNEIYAAPNIAGLFQLVRELAKKESADQGRLRVKFNSELGYPSEIDWIDNGSEGHSFRLAITKLTLNHSTEG